MKKTVVLLTQVDQFKVIAKKHLAIVLVRCFNKPLGHSFYERPIEGISNVAEK